MNAAILYVQSLADGHETAGALALVLVAVTSPLWYSHRPPGGRDE